MRRFLTLFAFISLSVPLFSQPCTGLGGTQTGPTIVFGDPANLNASVPGMFAGDYALVYVCAGINYTFSTCGTLGGDSEISVLDDTGMIITGVATDFADANTCGNHETLVWTAPAAYASGGYVQVVVSQNVLVGGPCQGGVALPMSDLTITASAACSPVGADCLNPYTAAFPVSESGLTTCGFGSSYTTSSCGDDNYLGGEDFVISFTVPGGSGGCYTIDVTNSSTYTGIQVLDDCPDAGGACIGFAGSAAADPSLQVNLVDGASYFMIISTFPAPECTSFAVDMTPCPAGTNCESPYIIPGLPFVQGGFTTQGFGDDYDTSNCNDDNYLGGEDFVFSLSVPGGAGGCYDIELTGTDTYAGVQILDGCPDNGGTCLGFAGSAGTDPSIRATLAGGADYIIIVSTFPAPDFTPFEIAINACPPGSDCNDPFVIASVPFSQSNTTEGFGNDYTMAPGCGPDDDYISGEDYVMEFTPSNSGCYDLSLTNGDSYLGLFVSTTCPPTNCDAYAESGAGNSLQTNVYLDAGTTYYFTVSTWAAPTFSPFDFEIIECAQDGEDCNAPVILTIGSTSSLSTCAMGDNYDDNDACGSPFMNGDDIVLEFTVPSDGCYDIEVSNSSNAAANFGAFILDDCPDAGATCIARGEAVGGTPTVTANLTAGTYTLVIATDDCSDFDVVVNSVACPAGATCANPLAVSQGANGPIDMAGSGDDYEPSDACGGDYLGGNDFVMTFVPGSSDCYSFTTSSAAGSNAAADLGLFVLDDCPDAIGANCLAFDEVDNGFPTTDAYLQAGQTYYIVVGAIEDDILGPTPSTTVFNLDISTGGTNCPPGANCGNPAIVSTGINGPYDACGAGNDYDDSDGCMNIYMNGEDFVMEFTAPADDCYDFILNGTGNSNPAADVGLFVLEDCPSAFGVNCLIQETQNNGFPMGTALLQGGQTYYIIVSAIETPLNTPSCTEFELTIDSGSSNCPVGETCSNALDLPSLGSYPGLTSCGAGNDYDQSMATNCSAAADVYLDGEDFVMTFTPSSSGCHNFQFSNPTDPDADSGVFIYDDCPDSNPGCVGFATSENGVPDNVITELVAGQTYYIVFSAIDFVNVGGTGAYSASCNGFDLEVVACDPPQPVQDCIGAIPVCDGTYFYDDGFLGDGNVNNESPAGNCLLDNELNSVWFVITIDQDGDFNFLITPENALDDYDFAVFDITTGGCSGIPSGASPELSCNYAISPGATGAGPGPGLDSQGADGVLLNGAIPVTAGQTLVLLVSNFSSSNDGFTLDIGSNPDVTAPTFTSITDPVACGATTFDVEFSEPVDCSTFAPCDFTVVFPDNSTHTLTDVTTGSDCGSGNPFEQNFTFTVADALLQDGTYTLQLGSGCGGIEDNCGNVQDNTSITFEVVGITCTIVDQTDEICSNGMGSLEVAASGGTSYTYSLNGGAPQTSGVFTGLSAGTYTIVATDVSGCTCQSMVTLMDAGTPPVIDNVTPMDATCGAANGQATVTISGGTAPYDVEINGITVNGNSPVTVTGLAAGTYPVNVTDANNCTVAGTVTINDSGAPVIDNITATDATCGSADGEATVTISGGTAPYDVEINGITVNGNSPVTVTGLAAGTYPVNVTDANNCTVAGTVTINDSGAPVIDNITATDATCGSADGEATVTISGGTAPYDVEINGITVNGNSPVTVTGLAAGTYPVNVTDANNCTVAGTVTINDGGAPVIDNITATDATCGSADGEATVTISGGTAPYDVEINGITVNGNSPVTVTGLAAGTYPVNVTDANNCTVAGTVTINDSGAPVIDNVTATDATCGSADGEATVTITGGTAPYDVEINGITVNGNSPVTVTGLAAGTYPVNVTDANNCTVAGTVTINDGGAPVIDNVVVDNANCGMTNGSLTINITGGTAPITYDLNNGALTQTDNNVFSNLDDGSYTVLVTDANGCTAGTTATLADLPGVAINSVNVTDANCGQMDGAVTINVSGGPAPITYDLNGTVQTDNGTFNGLAAGTYPLVVTDANNCTATQNVVIGDVAGVVLDGITIVDANCGDSNGSATINITGGTAPITYTLDGNNQIDNPVFTDLAEGSYPVLITDDNGCTVMGTANVGGSAAPVIDNIMTVDASCGQMDGSATINVSGGTPPYVYDLAGTVQNDPNNTFTMLASGNYALIVTDANNCTVTGTVNITDADGPVIDGVATVNATCGMATGELTVTISGGQPPYTILVNGTTQTSPNNTFTGLLPGNYPIQVTDVNGCVSTTTATVGDTPGVMITNITTVDATCGQANGSKTVSVSGGNSPYTFECNGVQQMDNGFFDNLIAGTYQVIVTDADGCADTQSVTINNTAGPVIDNVAVGDADCDMANGTLTINASQGQPPYSYTVDGNTQGSNVFSGLLPGVYDPVIVEDANGCTVTTTATVGNTPGVMITDITTTDATCGQADGSKTITVSGGTAPYTFECNGVQQIDNGTFTGLPSGSYPVMVTDANGCTATGTGNISDADGPSIDSTVATDADCGMSNGTITVMVSDGASPYNVTVNGSTLQTTGSIVFDNLPAGVYGIEVEDNNGCVASSSAEVLDIPGVVVDDVIIVDASCGQADGSKEIIVSGGTSPYTFECNGMTQIDNGLFENLAAGSYTYLVTDGNGCTATGTANISDANGPSIVNVSVVDASNGQADGAVTVEVADGTAPYTINLNGEDIMTADMATFMGLAAGTYTITVTDANGCVTTQEVTVGESQCPAIDNVVITDATCNNMDGSFTVFVSGGTAPYTIFANGNSTTGASPFLVANLASGVYPFTVTDANGCSVDGSATVNNLNGPTIDDVTVVDATNGQMDGSITVSASAGTPPYTFTINGTDMTDPSTATFTGLGAGTYPITVTDANGCVVTAEAVVNEAGCPMITDITATNSACGGATGTITVTASGGTPPLMYALDGNTPQASNAFMNVAAGVHTITVTDDAGCVVSGTVTVEEDDAPMITNVSTTAATCGDNNGTAVVTATGGTPPYTYDITGIPQNEDTFSDLQPGIYTVTVADVNGCSVTQMFTIDDLEAPIVDDVVVVNATCGSADGSVTIQASGGNGTLLYAFDGGAFTTNNVFDNIAAGGYDYAVMDDNCTLMGVVAVSNDGAPTIASIEVTDASCGTADGTLVINVMGGTPPLIYDVNGMMQVDNGTFNNLAAGDYTVVVTDANDCVAADVTTINEVGNLAISILGEATICDGDFTTLTADPLDQGYSFQWSTGATTDQIVVPSDAMMVTLNAMLGGCTGSANINITAVPLPVADAGADADMGCDLSSIMLDGSNSTGNSLQYSWTTPDGNIVGANNTPMVEVDAGGMYLLEVTESLANCVGLDTVMVTQGIAPVASAGPDMELTCLVQAVTLDGSGSDQGANFMYTWTGPGITPSNMNQNSPQVTMAGEYVIEVENTFNSCTVTDTVQLTANQTFPLAEIELVIPIDCNNLTIDIDGSNSSSGPNIAYQWLDGNMDPIPGETGNTLTVSMEGTYFLQVTDTENGCVSTASQDVNDITAYPLPSPSVSGVLTCTDTEVDLDATGSTTGPNITYEWFFGGNSIGTGLIIPTDIPGDYTLVVTDTSNDCTNEATVTVLEDTLPPTADAGNDTELDCLDPIITLDGSGSAQGVNIGYQWSGDNNQLINNATSLSPSITEVGTYTLLVSNSENGCTATDEVVVLENTEAAEAVELQFVTPTCQGDSNGAVIVSNVIGGQGPFVYSLDGDIFGSSSVFNNLTAGTYELSVQSVNGCVYTEPIVLQDGNDLEVDLGDNIFINIGETASFTPAFSISIADIDTFLWTTSDTLCFTCLDQVVAPLSTASYSIEVIDVNGCVASDDLTVIVNENLEVYIPNVFSPNNDGANDWFYIQAEEGVVVEIKTFKVFNRWGATVFENSGFMPNSPQEGWNGVFKGSVMDPQVFVFMAEVEFINGNVEMISGDVTLMK